MAITFQGTAASFRILGTAATPHNLFSIENTAGSTVTVRIRRLNVQLDATAVLTSVMPLVKSSRPAAIPSGGTVLAKCGFDTVDTSAANVIVRGANASDGGVATAITATAGNTIWQQYCMRMHTVVGQVLGIDNNVLPYLIDTDPLILHANEAILVQVVSSAGSSNPATNHWFVEVAWEEDA